MLARQSANQKAARTIALRELLDGALFIYGNLFGAHTENNYIETGDQRRDSELLLKINQKQGNAPSAIRSILHAGIIGQGLKVPTKHASKPDPELQNAYLNALSACCRSSVGVVGTRILLIHKTYYFLSGQHIDDRWVFNGIFAAR